MPAENSLASTKGQVAQRVKRFLNSNNRAAKELKNDIIEPLQELGEVCIVGGLVRDLAIYGLDDRPVSDIDLVVRTCSSKLRKFAGKFDATPNRFGGFGVQTTAFHADFWAFSSTWAKVEGHVSLHSAADLRKVTFFDWDAVIYSTRSNEVHWVDQYLDRLKARVLEINLLENPSVKGNLVRALRRLVMWEARPGKRLQSFLMDQAEQFEWSDLVQTELGAFQKSYLDEYVSFNSYWAALKNGEFLCGSSHHQGSQQELYETIPSMVKCVGEWPNKEVSNSKSVRASRAKRYSKECQLKLF